MTEIEFHEKTKRFLEHKEPFLFVVDFDKSETLAYSFDEAEDHNIFFDISGVSNVKKNTDHKIIELPPITVNPFPFAAYLSGFEKVVGHLKNGDSFLVNLTFPSEIISKMNLLSVFVKARAPYKMLFQNQFFVCT